MALLASSSRSSSVDPSRAIGTDRRAGRRAADRPAKTTRTRGPWSTSTRRRTSLPPSRKSAAQREPPCSARPPGDRRGSGRGARRARPARRGPRARARAGRGARLRACRRRRLSPPHRSGHAGRDRSRTQRRRSGGMLDDDARGDFAREVATRLQLLFDQEGDVRRARNRRRRTVAVDDRPPQPPLVHAGTSSSPVNANPLDRVQRHQLVDERDPAVLGDVGLHDDVLEAAEAEAGGQCTRGPRASSRGCPTRVSTSGEQARLARGAAFDRQRDRGHGTCPDSRRRRRGRSPAPTPRTSEASDARTAARRRRIRTCASRGPRWRSSSPRCATESTTAGRSRRTRAAGSGR